MIFWTGSAVQIENGKACTELCAGIVMIEVFGSVRFDSGDLGVRSRHPKKLAEPDVGWSRSTMGAIARCEQCGIPAGMIQKYSTKKYFPVGYPDSGLVCGTSQCRSHAIVWLSLEDEQTYSTGERVFHMDTATAKVKLQ